MDLGFSKTLVVGNFITDSWADPISRDGAILMTSGYRTHEVKEYRLG